MRLASHKMTLLLQITKIPHIFGTQRKHCFLVPKNIKFFGQEIAIQFLCNSQKQFIMLSMRARNFYSIYRLDILVNIVAKSHEIVIFIKIRLIL